MALELPSNESAKKELDNLQYKCRRCGGVFLYKEAHIQLMQLTFLPFVIHDCPDGHQGIADVIGWLVDNKTKEDNLSYQYQWLENIVNEKMFVMDKLGNRREYVPQDEVILYPEIVERKLSKHEISRLLDMLFNIKLITHRMKGVSQNVYKIVITNEINL